MGFKSIGGLAPPASGSPVLSVFGIFVVDVPFSLATSPGNPSSVASSRGRSTFCPAFGTFFVFSLRGAILCSASSGETVVF